ncbi:hypothetical protein NDU88_002917 [Pleurodeles waltl]|uniref:Uncharacterized protein n=1 Tax=Pleurodeles waltl TaxID=8319 RepID=A0AAV7RBE8_PLEWA|nr:hypothetical protein NDU88_002917 [Pleurodeles waltl]
MKNGCAYPAIDTNRTTNDSFLARAVGVISKKIDLADGHLCLGMAGPCGTVESIEETECCPDKEQELVEMHSVIINEASDVSINHHSPVRTVASSSLVSWPVAKCKRKSRKVTRVIPSSLVSTVPGSVTADNHSFPLDESLRALFWNKLTATIKDLLLPLREKMDRLGLEIGKVSFLCQKMYQVNLESVNVADPLPPIPWGDNSNINSGSAQQLEVSMVWPVPAQTLEGILAGGTQEVDLGISSQPIAVAYPHLHQSPHLGTQSQLPVVSFVGSNVQTSLGDLVAMNLPRPVVRM